MIRIAHSDMKLEIKRRKNSVEIKCPKCGEWLVFESEPEKFEHCQMVFFRGKK